MALLLGVSQYAFAEEAGDISVFEEKGTQADVLEESDILQKQLEALLSNNKKAMKAYEYYKKTSTPKVPKKEAAKEEKINAASENVPKAKQGTDVKNVEQAEPANQSFSGSEVKSAKSAKAAKTFTPAPSVSEGKNENKSLGQRFLERYYASTGRVYSDTPRQIEKIIETAEPKKSVVPSHSAPGNSEETFRSNTTQSAGKRFLKRYSEDSSPKEPLVMTDPSLSDYPERSLDCQYLDYEGGASSVIYVKPGYKTDVLLPAGDKLQRITAGDRQRFDFKTYYDQSESRWHIYIQPYQHDVTTNIIISTDRHTFQAKLETTLLLKPYVRWNVPDDINSGYKERNVVMDVDSVKDLNFSYIHKGKAEPAFAPMNVFDDKYWNTYLSFEKDKLQRINPVILGKEANGAMVIVPYEKRGDTLVMHKVYKEFELHVDNHTVNYIRTAR